MKRILFLLTFVFILSKSFAQPYKTIKTYKPYKWMLGVSWSAIDDNGQKFEGLFDYSNWNYMLFPTKVSLDRYFRYGWSAEVAATYTEYTPGKLVNDSTNASGAFFAFDINGKYSFYQHYAPRMRWIDPYFTFGVGYTYRDCANTEKNVPNVNLGFGFNIWIAKSFGIQIHSNAKIGVYPGFWTTHSNYLQHSAGLVFRWGEGKKHKNGNFGNKKSQWSHKKPKYKPNRGN